MKSLQKKSLISLVYLQAIALFLGAVLSIYAEAAPVDFTNKPLSNSSDDEIAPNLLFIFDDSGSMDNDYMPDWANSNDSFELDSSYNSIAYDPAIRYLPPAYYTSSGKNSTTYRSQTGVSTATGADSNSKPNWRRVKRDAYGVLSSSTTNLENLNSGSGPEYWVTKPGEYCKRSDLKDCNQQGEPDFTTGYIVPAPIRWCNSATNANHTTTPNPAIGACQGPRVSPFTHLRAPASAVPANTPIARITISGAPWNPWWARPRVTGITVNGGQIMRDRTNRSGSENNLAAWTVSRINDCTNVRRGNCTTAHGYTANQEGTTVVIYANGSPALAGVTPQLTHSGTLSETITPFAMPSSTPGERIQTFITPGNNVYKYPGTEFKHGNRSDCLGSVCTYNEEMTNYANWYTYYRTRAQMMKTASSLAFDEVDARYRVGFMTTSTLGSRSLDIKLFTVQHKADWYQKLFNTRSDRWTPLRGALSTAGRIFANKTNAHGTFTDPMEYACQKNFALLTTDGFWNTNDETSTYAGGPKALNGTSNVGNMDSAAANTPYGKREGSTARSNTLADVAMYYSQTDLRTNALGNCTGEKGATADGVCETTLSSGQVRNEKQTMTTLTLGLGVDGVLAYIDDYENQPGDFADIQSGSSTQWPDPIGNSGAERIDDLWHAAVNGDGTYFSAKNPTQVVSKLTRAISEISAQIGAGAAAATSSLNPVAGNNASYVPGYTTTKWTGNLRKQPIDPVTGFIKTTVDACVEDVVDQSTCDPSNVNNGFCVTSETADSCSAKGGSFDATANTCSVAIEPSCSGVMSSLVSSDSDTRNIFTKVINATSGASELGDFTYSNLTTAQQATLDDTTKLQALTQWATLTTDQQANVTGQNLVKYLRGQKGFEESSSNLAENQIFRSRSAVLGDIVGSKPAFMGAPTFSFGDSGYTNFKTEQANRQRMVYVGANDGMMHAFDAETLEEKWAYVPSMVIPNLWRLADRDYSEKHNFYVDGSIEISDICIAADCSTATKDDWRTILIAGLNSGGRGYYALDITDPVIDPSDPSKGPKLLWEFDASAANGDVDLGYTFGNPFVTKRNSDGKWVVVFTSGYNNIPDTDSFYTSSTFQPPASYTGGDGNGRLYVLDAQTGTKLSEIETFQVDAAGVPTTNPVGNLAQPSGLAKITAFVEDAAKNNKTKDVYAGDLLGNLWRFDLDAETAFLVTKFGATQPIMTKPILGKINGKRIVYVGTGKYLEDYDIQSVNYTTQSIYAVQDSETVTLLNPRNTLVQRTVQVDSSNTDVRISGPVTAPATVNVDFDVDRGWYVDLPDSGERQNVDGRLLLGTLIVPTIVPEASACQTAGYGWLNFLDYSTGLQVNTANVSTLLTNPAAGLSIVINTQGDPAVNVIDVKGGIDGKTPPGSGTISGFQMKRSIWREIVD